MNSPVVETTGFGGAGKEAAAAVSFLKTLSHEGRLQILCLLIDGPLSVGELADALALPQPTVSQQLMRLRAEGYVSAQREGKAMIYHLARQDVRAIISVLRDTFCAPGTPHASAVE